MKIVVAVAFVLILGSLAFPAFIVIFWLMVFTPS